MNNLKLNCHIIKCTNAWDCRLYGGHPGNASRRWCGCCGTPKGCSKMFEYELSIPTSNSRSIFTTRICWKCGLVKPSTFAACPAAAQWLKGAWGGRDVSGPRNYQRNYQEKNGNRLLRRKGEMYESGRSRREPGDSANLVAACNMKENTDKILRQESDHGAISGPILSGGLRRGKRLQWKKPTSKFERCIPPRSLQSTG